MSGNSDRRCVATNRRGDRCGKWAIRGAMVCLAHGGAAGHVRDAADLRAQEQRATAAVRRMTDVVDVSRYSDPVQALEFAIGATYLLAVRLTGLVSEMPDDELRWKGKTGDHLRGEVTAAQRALDSLRAAATDALRLGLEQRRAGITQETARMLETALDAALTASGVGLDHAHRAREAFRRNVVVIHGEAG